MAGLVLEGGSLRGLFTAGAMDALLDNNINFEYVIGVSAGITNAVSYISKQKGRNLEIIKKYRGDNRYMSKRNFLRCKSLFGLEFAFYEIPNKLIPFDWDTYYDFEGVIKVGMTDTETGQIVYKDGKSLDKKCTILRATCAIPFYFPPIMVEGKQYVDGGLADSIPIRQSIADGNDKNLVILTQPKGFVKKQSKSGKMGAFFYRNKFPNLSEVLIERPKLYNDTIDYIQNIEETHPENIVVLYPDYKLNSFESDVEVLEKTYLHGYETAQKNIEQIKRLFE